MEVHVEDSFWELFPEARIGLVIARGVDNSARRKEDVAKLLIEASGAMQTNDSELSAHPAIAPWREAYRRFGVKPSKYRSSIEALIRSTLKGRLSSINPLVDLYNSVSLRHLLPCGGEDLATIRGDVRLTRAVGDESFVPLGATNEDPPAAGEVIWADDGGVLCRCWNWREAERTKLTATTTDAMLIIEAVPPTGDVELHAACEDLATLVERYLGGTTDVAVLTNAGRRSVELQVT